MAMAPVDHLTDSVGVANSEIDFSANGEDGFENAGERFFWAQFHFRRTKACRNAVALVKSSKLACFKQSGMVKLASVQLISFTRPWLPHVCAVQIWVRGYRPIASGRFR